MAEKNNNTKTFAPKKDKILWILSILLLVAAVVVDYFFSNVVIALRIVGWIALLGIVATIVRQTSQGKRAWIFIKESRIELRKVVWPNRQETVKTTAIVIALVIITALLLWGIDSIFAVMVSWLTQ